MGKITSFSERHTFEMGRAAAQAAKEGTVVALIGDLGSGKTVFSRGLACGLHIDGTILSPTFTLQRSYEGDFSFNHFDIYRIDDIDELYEIGFSDIIGQGVTAVEWADKANGLLPNDTVFIHITRGKDENERVFEVNCQDAFVQNMFFEAMKHADPCS